MGNRIKAAKYEPMVKCPKCGRAQLKRDIDANRGKCPYCQAKV